MGLSHGDVSLGPWSLFCSNLVIFAVAILAAQVLPLLLSGCMFTIVGDIKMSNMFIINILDKEAQCVKYGRKKLWVQ